VKGDPVKCPDAESGWRLFERDNAGGGVPSNSDPNKLSRGGFGNLDDVPANTFIDPRLHAISMREPSFLSRRPLIVRTKTKALFGPE
jgi:hypothetical protein